MLHRLITFAAPPEAPAGVAGPLAALRLPGLSRWLTGAREIERDEGDEASLSPPHERALARAWGWRGADGGLPFAAHAAAADGIAVAHHAWARLTPAHWAVGAHGIRMLDPATLALSEPEARALFAAVEPLFTSEGVRLAWGAPGRWYAAHEAFSDLPCASVDRAAGDSVDRWLQGPRAPRLIQRLLHEAQMVLHAHPLTAAREAQGLPPVNAVWIDGCGVAQPVQDAAASPRLDDRLRRPAMAQDSEGWARAFAALDAEFAAALDAPSARAAMAVERLTLCGARTALSFERTMTAAPWWARWRRAPDPGPLLESL
ncbi:MAG: hypothetical protein ABI696_17840 [Rubrivivax sp.]